MSNMSNNISDMIDEQIGDDDELIDDADFDLDGEEEGTGNEDGEDLGDTEQEEGSQDRQEPSTTQDRGNEEPKGEQPAPGLKKVGNDYVDGKGNVVDAKGNVIAAAGAERRHFFEARAAKAENENLRTVVTRQQETLAQVKEYVELPQKLGLSPDDYRDALTLAQQFANDPVAAAKEVVARALALGHNVTDILGKDVGDSVDMVALRRMQEELHARPARERDEAERRQREANDRATEQYNSFIQKYPDSTLHENAIAHLMGQGDTAEVAYFKVRDFAISNGMDFSKPLGPQIEARANESLRKERPSQPQQRRRRPLNGGQGRTSETRMTDEPVEFGGDASYTDIVRDALKNAKR